MTTRNTGSVPLYQSTGACSAQGVRIREGKQLSDVYEKVLTLERSVELSWKWYRHTRQQWGPSIFGLIWKTAVDSQPRLRQPGDVPQWSLFHFCSVMTEQQREWGENTAKTGSLSVWWANAAKENVHWMCFSLGIKIWGCSWERRVSVIQCIKFYLGYVSELFFFFLVLQICLF